MHPFDALATPVRRRIIDILASGEHTSGQLADVVGYEFRISRTAVSKHLRLLREAGCVTVRAEENWRWYRLDKSGFDELEAIVSDLKAKCETAIGWDADERRERDPLASFASVPFKGPGRPRRQAARGRQTVFVQHPSPDDVKPWRMPSFVEYASLDGGPDADRRRRLET